MQMSVYVSRMIFTTSIKSNKILFEHHLIFHYMLLIVAMVIVPKKLNSRHYPSKLVMIMLLLSSFDLFNQLIGNFPINSCLIIVLFILLSSFIITRSWTFAVKVVSFHILSLLKVRFILEYREGLNTWSSIHSTRYSSYDVCILSSCSGEQNLGTEIQFIMILKNFTSMPQSLTWIMCVFNKLHTTNFSSSIYKGVSVILYQ